MHPEIIEFFRREGIEYYSLISYSDVKETKKYIIDREPFSPRSVIIFLLPYYAGETVNISRYAASLDYHIIIKDITDRLLTLLKTIYKGAMAKGYGDHSPIDERDAALSAGLGILGKNGLLINEKYGSYIFIADVVTDIPEEIIGTSPKLEHKTCEGCGICFSACPTGILSGRGENCLSQITQKKGDLTESECALMRKFNTVWGCDECQKYCPYNKEPQITPIEFFKKDRIEELTDEILDSLSDEEFGRRAFAWRKRETVKRNLSVMKENK